MNTPGRPDADLLAVLEAAIEKARSEHRLPQIRPPWVIPDPVLDALLPYPDSYDGKFIRFNTTVTYSGRDATAEMRERAQEIDAATPGAPPPN